MVNDWNVKVFIDHQASKGNDEHLCWCIRLWQNSYHKKKRIAEPPNICTWWKSKQIQVNYLYFNCNARRSYHYQLVPHVRRMWYFVIYTTDNTIINGFVIFCFYQACVHHFQVVAVGSVKGCKLFFWINVTAQGNHWLSL